MQVHSPEELDAQLSEAGSRLTVLCCKARSCRPCKVWLRCGYAASRRAAACLRQGCAQTMQQCSRLHRHACWRQAVAACVSQHRSVAVPCRLSAVVRQYMAPMRTRTVQLPGRAGHAVSSIARCINCMSASQQNSALRSARTVAQMFARKYVRLADSFPDVTFCEIYGDENPATRVRRDPLQSIMTSSVRCCASQLVHALHGLS